MAFPTPQARAAFRAMPARDQRHSLRVLQAIQGGGHRDAELLLAALLHDIGKGEGRIRLWHRVVWVFVHRVSPSLAGRLGREGSGSWRYPFYLLAAHAERGAALAQAIGCPPEVVRLIRSHHTAGLGSQDERLRALQEADRAN